MNNSLAEVHPELITDWLEKNLPLTPDDITFVFKNISRQSTSVKQGDFIDILSATCHLPVYEIIKVDCESLVTCNQTRYNEEKRGGKKLWNLLLSS